MLVAIAVCAVASMFVNAASLTIPCDFGASDILGGYLPSESVVNVKALRPNGEYKTVAENVSVIGARWEQVKGSNICYIDLRMSLIQKWRAEGYSDYRIDFPMAN